MTSTSEQPAPETAAAQAGPFDSVDDVVEALSAQGYIADRRLATTVFLLTRLEKPLLLEGPAGVGKTELAKMLAAATGRKFLRLQCYEGQDETKALYEWDYGKQLLYTQILREKIGQVVEDAPDIPTAVDRIGAQDSRLLLRALPRPAPAARGDPLRRARRAADRRGRPRRRGPRGGAAGDARRVPDLGARGRDVRRGATSPTSS